MLIIFINIKINLLIKIKKLSSIEMKICE